jgi:hypothetical protein
VQKRINELEPGKLRAYNDLLGRFVSSVFSTTWPSLIHYCRQKDLQERINQGEARLHEVNSAIQHIEEGEKGYSHRKEYANLEKQVCSAIPRRESPC